MSENRVQDHPRMSMPCVPSDSDGPSEYVHRPLIWSSRGAARKLTIQSTAPSPTTPPQQSNG